MQRTCVHTQIYAIKQSAKGWSEFIEFFFNKEKAAKRCRDLIRWAEENGHKTHFRLYTITTEDNIVYTKDE